MIAKINAEVVRALASTDARKIIVDGGMEPLSSSPAELAAFLDTEIAKWAKVIRDGNIKAE